MRAVTRTVLATASAVVMVAASPLVASAVNAPVYAHQPTSEGSSAGGPESGATAAADLVFTGARTLKYRNFRVNDTCPGDGFRALGRAVVIHRDGTRGYGQWHEDDGICESPEWFASELPYSSTKDIMRAGVQACVDFGGYNLCREDFEDNQYT